MAADGTSREQALEPEAFKKLYPEQYYQRFIDIGVRPDGRPFGRCRPTTIGLDAVGTADASALVKVGSTTALAGIKLEVLALDSEQPREGQLVVNVETTPMSSADMRPGRPSQVTQCCAEQVAMLLKTSKAVDLRQLVIGSGRAVWVAYLDIYVLDADGCLLDVCLLAAAASLASLKALPSVSVDESGKVVHSADRGGEDATMGDGGASTGLVDVQCMPVSLTCGLYREALIADPTAEEEALMAATVCASVDGSGRLIGLWKPGGSLEANTTQLQECIEAAKLRHTQVMELLEQALAAQRMI